MSVFAFSPTIYRPQFAVSPISNSSYHDRRRVTAQFKETEEAPTPNPKQEEEIKPLQAPAPSKILSPSIDIDIKKVVQKTAGTFAPRASTARKNPAVPGSTLYTIFEVQGYLSMVFGGALAFNLIFPSSEPDIWRLMGMWSIWMFMCCTGAVWNRLEPVGSVELAGTGMEPAGSIRNQPKTVGYSRSGWLVLPNWTSSDNTDLSRARAARSWQKLLRVGSGILLIFSRSYNLFNRLYMAVLYISWYNRYFWAIQRPRRVH